MLKAKTVLLVLIGSILGQVSMADEWDATGFVGIDGRAFLHDAAYSDQSNGANTSLLFQPEFYWRNEDGNQRVSVVGFARVDSHDSQRTHVDLREAYWGYEGDSWDLNIGLNRVFWGVTESRHLVDIINQTDLVEDIDQEDKLGQPMLNLNLQRDFGDISLFVMPRFRERSFAGEDGRLRSPLPVDEDAAIYESSDGKDHVDFALRYSHYLGDVDIGLHYFTGTSREPRFLLAPEMDRLIPVYDQIDQVGLDLQYTRDAWLWKLEAITRESEVDDFFAFVGGLEYTFYGVFGGSTDAGFLIEYLYDDRNEVSPPTSFDNDVFVGTRIALNDAQDTSVLAGLVVDQDNQEMFVNIEAERRFGDSLSAELRFRAFLNTEPGSLLHAIDQDDYVQLRLNWYY